MIRYSIRRSPYQFSLRWVVRAHYQGASSTCGWFDSWASALGYVKSIYGWQW